MTIFSIITLLIGIILVSDLTAASGFGGFHIVNNFVNSNKLYYTNIINVDSPTSVIQWRVSATADTITKAQILGKITNDIKLNAVIDYDLYILPPRVKVPSPNSKILASKSAKIEMSVDHRTYHDVHRYEALFGPCEYPEMYDIANLNPYDPTLKIFVNATLNPELSNGDLHRLSTTLTAKTYESDITSRSRWGTPSEKLFSFFVKSELRNEAFKATIKINSTYNNNPLWMEHVYIAGGKQCATQKTGLKHFRVGDVSEISLDVENMSAGQWWVYLDKENFIGNPYELPNPHSFDISVSYESEGSGYECNEITGFCVKTSQ